MIIESELEIALPRFMQNRLSPLLLRAFPILILIQLVCIVSGNAIQVTEADTSETITSANKFGYIEFEIEPDTVFLYLNEDFNKLIILTDETKLRLLEGVYRMYIFGKDISDRIIEINIVKDEPHLFRFEKANLMESSVNNSIYAAFMWDANLMIFSDVDTEISILNTGHHSFGTVKAKLPSGTYRIEFISASGRVKEKFIEVNNYELKTLELYMKPNRGVAMIGGFVPGASQLYKQQTVKAALAFGMFTVSAGFAIHYNQQLSAGSKEFETVLQSYYDASNEIDALIFGNRMEQLYQDNKRLERNRNIFRTTAILIYLANIVDAFQEPSMGFAQRRFFNPFRDFSIDITDDLMMANFQIRF